MIWQYIFSALKKVVSQKEATQWMLNTPAHLDHIFQDITTRQLIVLDVDNPDSYQ